MNAYHGIYAYHGISFTAWTCIVSDIWNVWNGSTSFLNIFGNFGSDYFLIDSTWSLWYMLACLALVVTLKLCI